MPGSILTAKPILEHQGTLPLVYEEDEERTTRTTMSVASSVTLPELPVDNNIVSSRNNYNKIHYNDHQQYKKQTEVVQPDIEEENNQVMLAAIPFTKHPPQQFPQRIINVVVRGKPGRIGTLRNGFLGGGSTTGYLRNRGAPRRTSRNTSNITNLSNTNMTIAHTGSNQYIPESDRERSGLELTGSRVTTPQYLKHRRK